MRRVVVLVLLVLAMLVGACTAEQRRAIGEAVVRNVVAFEAAKEFKNHGYPIHGHLTCKAKASRSNESQVGVVCHGTTTAGQPVVVVGTANNIRGNHGHFVGTVNGKQVFVEKCLGC